MTLIWFLREAGSDAGSSFSVHVLRELLVMVAAEYVLNSIKGPLQRDRIHSRGEWCSGCGHWGETKDNAWRAIVLEEA